jgi:hypothetical protein
MNPPIGRRCNETTLGFSGAGVNQGRPSRKDELAGILG